MFYELEVTSTTAIVGTRVTLTMITMLFVLTATGMMLTIVVDSMPDRALDNSSDNPDASMQGGCGQVDHSAKNTYQTLMMS